MAVLKLDTEYKCLSEAGDLTGFGHPNNLIDCKLVKTVESVFYRTKFRREVATAMGGRQS